MGPHTKARDTDDLGEVTCGRRKIRTGTRCRAETLSSVISSSKAHTIPLPEKGRIYGSDHHKDSYG